MTDTPTKAAEWPPTDPERVTAIGGAPSLRRRGDSLPGVPLDAWLEQAGANPTGPEKSIVVTTAGLPVEVGKALVAKAAECVRGVELIDRLISSEGAMGEIMKRTGLDADTAQRTLRMKRDDLCRRRDAFQAALSAPVGFSLLIEVDGAKYSID